jgi:hypothetical protein
MTEYSDSQLDAIAKEVSGLASEERRADKQYMDKKYVKSDWDPELFISDLYEMWLSAIQQGQTSKINGRVWTEETVFEQFLQDSLITTKWRAEELQREYSFGLIDVRTFQMGKELCECSTAAIRIHLEKSDAQRLIGV